VENEEKTEVYNKDMLLRRIKRVEGQLRGIHKMISEDRDCVSIVTQLAAVRSGVEGVGALVLNNCMKLCFLKGAESGTNIDSLSKAVAPTQRPPGRGRNSTSALKSWISITRNDINLSLFRVRLYNYYTKR
jgi:DNA-binding FrmR family transcriptional regulator